MHILMRFPLLYHCSVLIAGVFDLRILIDLEVRGTGCVIRDTARNIKCGIGLH